MTSVVTTVHMAPVLKTSVRVGRGVATVVRGTGTATALTTVRLAVPGPRGPAISRVQTFTVEGTLAVGTSRTPWLMIEDGELEEIWLAVALDSAPTGQEVIVDMLLNGTDSVWPNPDDRPTIQPGQVKSLSAAIPTLTAFVAGDTYAIVLAQVGTGEPGAELTVAVKYH